MIRNNKSEVMAQKLYSHVSRKTTWVPTTPAPIPRLPGGGLLKDPPPKSWTWQLSLYYVGGHQDKDILYAKTKNL